MESYQRPAASVCSRRPHFLFTVLLLATLAGFGAVSPAGAQNEVGIYWDTGYVETEFLVNPPPGPVTGHIVVHDPTTVSGILGWELCVDVEGNGEFLGWVLEGQTINVATPPCFTVGINEPLPPINGAVLLATFEYYVTDGRPAVFSLVPHHSFPIPGQMSFVSGDNPDELIPLATPEGAPEVAWINRGNPWPEFDVQEIDFGVRPIGMTTTRGFVITNTGGGVLILDLSLAGDCDMFALPEISEPIPLAPGMSQEVVVAFTPEAAIDYACNVELAGPYPPVNLHGTGRPLIYGYIVTPELDFGIITIGQSLDGYATLRNTGETPIPIVPELLNCGPDFAIVVGNEPVTVEPGGVHRMTVRFQPTVADTWSCHLGYGGDIDQTALHGVGREAIIDFTILGDLDFGTVFLDNFQDRVLTITNVGEDPFTITPSLVDCGPEFLIISGAEPWNLAPGQVRQIIMRFVPTSEGEFACALNLGNILPEVPVTGRGVDLIWNVTPSEVAFLYTRVGEFREVTVTVENTSSDQDLPLAVQLVGPNDEYTLTSGAGVHAVPPGMNHEIVIRFAPLDPGYFSGELILADFIPRVPISGVSDFHDGSCFVSPTLLEFGEVLVSQARSRIFTVQNTTEELMVLAPTSDSPLFSVNGGPLELASGEAAEFAVTFEPDDVGEHIATISTGHPDCPTVDCVGTGIAAAPGDPDQIGIYFDDFYTVNEIEAPAFTVIPGYLVLSHPSDMSGVIGWECAVNLIGPAFFLGWGLEGQHINVGTLPEFIVGIAEPLPANDVVLLASFDLFITAPSSAVLFTMNPIANPTLPGHMIWVANDGFTPIPMVTSTGLDLVATINEDAPVGLSAPTPELSLNGGAVRLVWPAPATPDQECHVYRRTADALPERLTDFPLLATGGTVEYIDHPTGFAAGTRLFYSYAILIGGVESARSPEVETQVPTAPALITRLLPNVPNPFNPQTEIRFELGAPSSVRVVIYDVTGRQVKVLANDHLGPGPHTRIWQGQDAGGRQVSSGAYYVRLEVDGRVDHQKIMLLK